MSRSAQPYKRDKTPPDRPKARAALRFHELGARHGLSAAFRELVEGVAGDQVRLEAALGALRPVSPAAKSAVYRAAEDLLALGGKRLRPRCLFLAARLGTPPHPDPLFLATAVELVHTATLLHDDVVDLGIRRRGAPSAWVQHGNVAAIFAGDFLLVAAIERVLSGGTPGLLEALLASINQMIEAEALQLDAKKELRGDRRTYLNIAEGKTAALFRFAFRAGGELARLPPAALLALDNFALNLGIAFQITDDVLDLLGPELLGKDNLRDLHEGKLSFPILLASERDPALFGLIKGALGAPREEAERLIQKAAQAVHATGAIEAAESFARELAHQGVRSLLTLPRSAARDALEALAQHAVERRH